MKEIYHTVNMPKALPKEWKPKATPTAHSLSITDEELKTMLSQDNRRIRELEAILASMGIERQCEQQSNPPDSDPYDWGNGMSDSDRWTQMFGTPPPWQ